MIFVLLLSACFSVGILVFVLWPVARNPRFGLSRPPDGFSNEEELRTVLGIRDALLQKLINNDTKDERVAGLNDEDCLNTLVRVAQRLQKAGLPFLPLAAAIFLFTFTQNAQAQPADIKLPEAARVGELLAPRIHEFVLSPAQGALFVRYTGYFKYLGAANEESVLLPLPEGLEELKIPNNPKATLEPNQNGAPVLRMPISQGNQHVQAEFFLSATDGVAHWQNKTLQSLPGTVLILMPEFQGGLRNFLQTFSDNVNVWPARIPTTPQGFDSSAQQETYNPNEPNYQLLMKLPPQFTRRLLRFGDDSSPYPRFDIVGIVPTRTYLWTLVSCFAVALFLVTLIIVARGSKQVSQS